MKQTKHILVTIAMLLCSLTVSAEAVQIEGIWYNLVPKAKQAEVTRATYSGDITIPSCVSYEGIDYRVTSIGAQAFEGCSSLTSITIPESVTSIGNYAFYNCSSLTSITIPESVTSIGKEAFFNCRNLTSITIPKNVTSIGEGAFGWCRSLTSITIPENMTSIGSEVFMGCSGLTSIIIPESVTAIGSRAFSYCSSLTSITLPENVTSIGSEAFMGCSGLTSIIIPEGVTRIRDDAFYNCSSLTSITIPEGVTSIGEKAFSGCSNLTSVVLPKSVKSIGSLAFANCADLADVYCYAESVPSATADAFEGSYPEYATLRVPASAVESYKATAPWSSFGTIVSLDATITHISLNKTDVTLTEGESSLLTFTTTPEDADRNLFSWNSSNPSVATVDGTGNVTAIAPGIATITVTANDGSGLSASCEVTVKKRVQGTCAAPIISYAEGKIVLTCETEGAKVITDVVAEDAQRYEGLEIALSAAYTITAYATKEGYLDSDPVTLTLCWVPCTEEHEDDDTDGIITLPAKPVLIQTAGGVITLTGLPEGAEVAVYDTAGTSLAAATAENGTATLTTNLNTGSTAIVKIGGHSVKVIVK